MSVYISCPRFVQQLIGEHVLVSLKPLSHSLPEHPKMILYLLLIVIQTLPVQTNVLCVLFDFHLQSCWHSHCLAHCISEVVCKEVVFRALLCVGIPAERYIWQLMHNLMPMQYIPCLGIHLEWTECRYGGWELKWFYGPILIQGSIIWGPFPYICTRS